MASLIIFLPITVWTLGVIFLLGGVYVAIEETLKDSFCAELVGEEHHGMAFGTLATVNGGRFSVEHHSRGAVDRVRNERGEVTARCCLRRAQC